MKRIALDNGNWFDIEKATEFKEDSKWNGNNHISVNTGSQWDHQQLYLTASGNWILNSWSQWQGSIESYIIISTQEAAVWLSRNGYDGDYLKTEIAALEI